MNRRSLSIVVLLMLVPHVARAGDPMEDFPDPAAARKLFDEARALMERSRYAEACPKLEESVRLEPDIGAELNLADCNEHIGKLATAWAGFLDVASRSKFANQTDREKIARKRAQALEPRLPKLVIAVSNVPQGLEVRRDAVAIGTATWGTAIPVDPGPHRVTAWAPGKRRWVMKVESAEGTTMRVEVPRELAPTADDAAAPEVAAVATAPSDTITAPPTSFAAPDTAATSAATTASVAPANDMATGSPRDAPTTAPNATAPAPPNAAPASPASTAAPEGPSAMPPANGAGAAAAATPTPTSMAVWSAVVPPVSSRTAVVPSNATAAPKQTGSPRPRGQRRSSTALVIPSVVPR